MENVTCSRHHPLCCLGQQLFIVVCVFALLVFARNYLFHFQGEINKGEQVVSGVGADARSYFCSDILVVGLPGLVHLDPDPPLQAAEERDLAKAGSSDPTLQRDQVKLEASPLMGMPPGLHHCVIAINALCHCHL